MVSWQLCCSRATSFTPSSRAESSCGPELVDHIPMPEIPASAGPGLSPTVQARNQRCLRPGAASRGHCDAAHCGRSSASPPCSHPRNSRAPPAWVALAMIADGHLSEANRRSSTQCGAAGPLVRQRIAAGPRRLIRALTDRTPTIQFFEARHPVLPARRAGRVRALRTAHPRRALRVAGHLPAAGHRPEGRRRLARHPLAAVALPALVVVAAGALIPLVAYPLLRRVDRLSRADAGSIAGHCMAR